MRKIQSRETWCVLLGLALAMCFAPAAAAQNVTYKPYIELGDAGAFGPSDQMVVAWQTDEKSPNPPAYVVELGTTPSYGTSMMPSLGDEADVKNLRPHALLTTLPYWNFDSSLPEKVTYPADSECYI